MIMKQGKTSDGELQVILMPVSGAVFEECLQ